MITPKELKQKANRLVDQFIVDWYDGTAGELFPLFVRADMTPSGTASEVANWATALRTGSKASVGRGYSIEMRFVNSRAYGQNEFPHRIYFETPADLLAFTNRQDEFDRTVRVASALRLAFPMLEDWGRRNLRSLSLLANDINNLVAVTEFLSQNPRPGVFARELPVPVHSKFVEENEGLLRAWLDRILPPASISADEEHFARRFGLRYVEPMVWIRALDLSLTSELGFPEPLIGLSIGGIARMRLERMRIIIVENRVNLLTLPPIRRALAMGGMGNAVLQLASLLSVSDCDVTYWGDMDAHGYEILDRFRRLIPRTRSALMDHATLERYSALGVEGPACELHDTKSLTPSERAAYEVCVTTRLRIEQERIPHTDVLQHFGLV